MLSRSHAFLLLSALCAGHLPAQEPRTGVPAPKASALGKGIWRTPIHTLPGDAQYGWWASGDDYKVSFHDGFVFYPCLGAAYPENLPLRWTTQRVTVGGEPIVDLREREHVHGDSRYEYRGGGVDERYDVRPEGVEQSFVIAARPRGAGDLVVEGRIETRLVPAQLGADPRHQALDFTDTAGNRILRYGAATAVDARGRTTPVATSLEQGIVRLVTPGQWLAEAEFPVVIDPLTSTTVISTTTSGGAIDPSLFREDQSPVNNTMGVFSRVFSSGDYDVYGRLGGDNLAAASGVFSDISATRSSILPDVSYVRAAGRWVIAYWRHDAAGDRILVYFHDLGNLTLNSGRSVENLDAPTQSHTFPSIGGQSNPSQGTTALVTYRSDPFFGNSSTSVIRGAFVDAATRTFVSNFTISPSGLDAEDPDVNCQIGWGDDGWVVAYHGRNSTIDDYDVYVSRVALNATVGPAAQVGPDNLGDKVRPVVQGWDGYYMVAMLQDVTPEISGRFYGRNIYVEPIDWPNATVFPTKRGFRPVASSLNQDLTQLNLGFDGVSYSHWCLAYDSDVFNSRHCNVARLGMSGGVTEWAALDGGVPGRYGAAVTWNGVRREFPVIFCAADSSNSVLGQVFQYSQFTWLMPYGNGCGPGTIGANTNPQAGTRFFTVKLENAPPGQPAALWLSSGAGGQDLAAFGAPNCFLNLASIDVVLSTATDASGAANVTVSLPDVPLFVGDLYWQYAYVWPAAPTPLTVGLTRGLRGHTQPQ